MAKYLLSIDQGTTSSRAILYTQDAQVIGSAQQTFPQHFVKNGWVEHDPVDILQTVLTSVKNLLAQQRVTAADIIAIGIANQRETTLVWNKKTGQPIYNAIVWQDRRTSEYCDSLRHAGHTQMVNDKTGLVLDPYFSATKVRWILDNVTGAKEQAHAGELAFGTVDSYLLWQLTNGKAHKTDATNASRTLLFNIHQQCWDEELLALFDIPLTMLPEVMDSAADFGMTSSELFCG